MNWIDIGFLILVSGGGMFGYLTGFLNQIGRVIGLFAAVYGSVHLHLPVMKWLGTFVDQPFSGLLAYVLLFVLIYVIALLILNLLDSALHAAELKSEDRKLGALLGIAKGVLISAMLLFGFALYPGTSIARDIESSYTGRPLLILTQAVVVRVPEAVRSRIEDTLERVHSLSKSDTAHETTLPAKNRRVSNNPSLQRDQD
jgi:membrane protein required for colicin V production